MSFEGAPPEFGDVILVPFPFTSQAASKQRPAVVVSSCAYGREHPDIALMAITSQLRPTPQLGEVWLERWRDAGLIKPSAVKPVLATLEQGLVIRTLGRLADEDQQALRHASARSSAEEHRQRRTWQPLPRTGRRPADRRLRPAGTPSFPKRCFGTTTWRDWLC